MSPENDPGRDLRARSVKMLSYPIDFLMRWRSIVKFLLHATIFIFAYITAYLLRFEFSISPVYLEIIRHTIMVVLVTKAMAFLAFGLFQGWWRYVSMRDILPIAGGCTLGSFLFWCVDFFLMPDIAIPRSIFVIDWGLTLMIVLGARYFIRFGREVLGRGKRDTARRVLVVGAGSAGLMIVREIRENPGLGMIEVGFVDDDRAKIGTRIDGVPVLGPHEDIEAICEKHEIDEIIIAIPSATPSHLRHILDHCSEVKANARIVAEAAARFGVERFVLVSTDKAVRPTNVMGATKRLAELIVYAITGERRAVVEKLDALVKGYKPMYEFHGGQGAPVGAAAPKTAEQGRSCELPLNRDSHGSLDPALPLPFPPSKSVH